MSDAPFQSPIVTVDVVVLTLTGDGLSLLLAHRLTDPYQGTLALPGGYVRPEEDDSLHSAAARVVRNKTGFAPRWLEQIYTFSGRARDPRGWSISTAYYALVLPDSFGDGLAGVLRPVDALPPLPFDHGQIADKAVARVRAKSRYSSLPLFFLPELFTLSQAHDVYQRVFGVGLSRQNLIRKLTSQGLIRDADARKPKTRGRPASWYRMTDTALKEIDNNLSS